MMSGSGCTFGARVTKSILYYFFNTYLIFTPYFKKTSGFKSRIINRRKPNKFSTRAAKRRVT